MKLQVSIYETQAYLRVPPYQGVKMHLEEAVLM